MAPDFVCELRILAVVRVIGHLTVLVSTVMVGLRLICSAQIVRLSINFLNVARCDQVAALLHKLVLDLAHAV